MITLFPFGCSYFTLLGRHFLHPFLVVFWNMVFVDGFLIPVKELELLTNVGQWIRGFGCRGILYIFVL
jgi:hypothetical protein